MTESKGFFRTVLDAMIESRTRQAERTLAHYKTSMEQFDRYANKR